MFLYLYKSRLIALMKKRTVLFFSLILPILLSLLLFICLNNFANKGNESVKLGIVGENDGIGEYFKKIENENGSNLFQVINLEKEEGEHLLRRGEIKGLIHENNTLLVLEKGKEESLISYYFNRYRWIENYYELMSKETGLEKEQMDENTGYTAVVPNDTDRLPNHDVLFFYNLLAIIFLLGARLGFQEISLIEEKSHLSIRLIVTPTHNSLITISNLIAAFTLHFSGAVISVVFISKILNVNLLIELVPLIFIGFVTSLLGFSLGVFLNIAIKANIRVRSTILNILLVVGSITAGIFNNDIKYAILELLPAYGFINPFILVYESIYSIARGNNLFHINMHLLVLLGATMVFSLYSLFYIKRRDYAVI